MNGLETALLIIVGLPVAGLSTVLVAWILRSWSLKTRELKLKEQQFHLEARIRRESVDQKMLTAHESRMASSQMEKMEAELIDMRAQISDLTTRLTAFTGAASTSSHDAQTDFEPEPKRMME